ncbi:dipeptidyl aminopeptidase/acylaminoacyl peptidase [Litoreibacter ponti]|uniref:Dipeptidyl aminopeptidase/acylaminoacyl peptidase n=1 Tax=Litoreibacter ponti TaxID=1510457 RepID=A0A2T6BN10_9RHOB|nr:prolyl oligopeptidase family serine peptidase [Litoreibacter ponti]PTX57455.1 dipeptidyl aminopeptidase/acylaminoacyl peptidase [Litoreibacter ponti]
MRRIVKVLALLGVVLATGRGMAYLWASRDTPPTHPALAEANLPPLIPVRDFWADTDAEWDYHVSGDGRYLAHRVVRGTQEVVALTDLSTDTELATIPELWHFYWDPHAPLLHVITHDERLWRVDPTNPARDAWVDITPRGFRNWNFATIPRAPQDRRIVSSRDRNPAFHDVYTVRPDGGGKELLIRNEGQTLAWIMDHDNLPLMRIDRAEDDAGRIMVRTNADGTQWRELMTVDALTTFWVVEVTPDARFALAHSSRGRDKAALVKVDLETGMEEVLAEDPELDLMRSYSLDPFDGEIDLVRRHSGGGEPIALTPRGEVLKREIMKYSPRVQIDSLGVYGPGRFVTVTLSPEARNYIYLLIDTLDGTSQELGEFSFRRKHLDKLVPTEEVRIPARDGLEIPALLLRPKGVTGPAPLVVEVHGGPAAHVDWNYHHFRQFLTNRGYAVLSVNFRGSTGFGRAFQAKGFREYGRAMQTDLYDAAQWAVDQGIADPDALAIQGGSYGGYASGMAATERGGPFDAAIVEHAVLDVGYQMRNNPFAWGLNEVYMTRYFGTIDADFETMETYSPITRAADLAMPTLVVAGKRDRVVGFEQSEEFLRRARESDHAVEELIFEDEGHGIDRWQNSVRHARRVEDFLARHLGGRSGGWDYIEIAADWLD